MASSGSSSDTVSKMMKKKNTEERAEKNAEENAEKNAEESAEMNLEMILALPPRPAIYTAVELFESLKELAKPFMDVITWQVPLVSSAWLFLGVLAISFLSNITLPSLVGMLGLFAMGLVMMHASVVGVEDYHEMRRRQMHVQVRVPPEVVERVAHRVTIWVNRWVATAQSVLFGPDYHRVILITIGFFNVYMIFNALGISKVLMIGYILLFIVPKLWSHLQCEMIFQDLTITQAMMILVFMGRNFYQDLDLSPENSTIEETVNEDDNAEPEGQEVGDTDSGTEEERTPIII